MLKTFVHQCSVHNCLLKIISKSFPWRSPLRACGGCKVETLSAVARVHPAQQSDAFAICAVPHLLGRLVRGKKNNRRSCRTSCAQPDVPLRRSVRFTRGGKPEDRRQNRGTHKKRKRKKKKNALLRLFETRRVHKHVKTNHAFVS